MSKRKQRYQPPGAEPDEILLEDAPSLAGVSRGTLYRWVSDGMPFADYRRLPCIDRYLVGPNGRFYWYRFVSRSELRKASEGKKQIKRGKHFRPSSPGLDEISTKDAAALLGVNRQTIYNWMRHGMPFADHRRLPSIKRALRGSDGRLFHYRFIRQCEIQKDSEARELSAVGLVPAHEASSGS